MMRITNIFFQYQQYFNKVFFWVLKPGIMWQKIKMQHFGLPVVAKNEDLALIFFTPNCSVQKNIIFHSWSIGSVSSLSSQGVSDICSASSLVWHSSCSVSIASLTQPSPDIESTLPVL